jgi:sulfur relay (sulfurtransferase) complex TusBCD TusD component (DsrE family)
MKYLFILNDRLTARSAATTRCASPAISPGATRGTMDQLAEWSAWADKVLVF